MVGERWKRGGGPDDPDPPVRSALTLRLVLASVGLVLWAVVGALALARGGPGWLVALAAVLVVVSVVDLVVVGRRKARGEPG